MHETAARETPAGLTSAVLPPVMTTSLFFPGQILPLNLAPSLGALRRLSDVVERGARGEHAEELRDPRIPHSAWQKVIIREFAMTLGWGAERALARTHGDATPTPIPAWHGRGRALVLLPAHGLTVHTLRRAMPFALCGIPTQVVGHERDLGRIARILAEIRALTGLDADQMELCRMTATEAIRMVAPGDLVVVTGSRRTAEAVERESPAQVLGATGGCTVLTGTDSQLLSRVAARLREHDFPDSCTRLHGWRLLPGPGPAAPRNGQGGPLAEIHPSAVYQLGAPMDASVGVEDGYTVLPCDESGTVGTVRGFARDPLHRWPGDFLI